MTTSTLRRLRATLGTLGRIVLASVLGAACHSTDAPARQPAVFTDARSGYELAESRFAQGDLAGAESLHREVAQRFAYSGVAKECEVRLADIEEARGHHAEADRLYAKWLFEHRGDPKLAEAVRAKQAEAERRWAISSPVVLTLTHLEYYVGDQLFLKLGADGRIELRRVADAAPTDADWTFVGRLMADGKVTGPDGRILGALLPDGTYRDADGRAAAFQLFEDGLAMGDYKRVTFDWTGTLRRGERRDPKPTDPHPFTLQLPAPTRVEGAADDGARRTALFVFAFVLHHELKSTP